MVGLCRKRATFVERAFNWQCPNLVSCTFSSEQERSTKHTKSHQQDNPLRVFRGSSYLEGKPLNRTPRFICANMVVRLWPLKKMSALRCRAYEPSAPSLQTEVVDSGRP